MFEREVRIYYRARARNRNRFSHKDTKIQRREEEKRNRSRPQDVGDTRAHQDRGARVIAQIGADFFES